MYVNEQALECANYLVNVTTCTQKYEQLWIPCGAPHEFLGDASHVDAGSSEATSLDETHLQENVSTEENPKDPQ